MTGLSIDTSGQRLTLALWDDDRLIASHSEPAQQRHSDLMTTVLDSLLEQAHLGVRDIGVVAVCNGPGSFTGLRVGISFAKGLAMGLGLRVIALNTLEALAFSASEVSGLLSPMLDAKRKQVYTALYNKTGDEVAVVKGPLAIEPKEWLSSLPRGTVVFGSGAVFYHNLIAELSGRLVFRPYPEEPMPQGLAALSLRKHARGGLIEAEGLDAFYIRQADAVARRPGG